MTARKDYPPRGPKPKSPRSKTKGILQVSPYSKEKGVNTRGPHPRPAKTSKSSSGVLPNSYFIYLCNKLIYALKLPVNGGKTYIRHLVQLSQPL